ncbi:5-formyltetrahydrofolate cyclo-ligase [Anaerosporobacter sp.]|uniref:5-formyltetrahydrofolate cyclo-ligase n=1 Tax=Anaerosporobacter sp. TaxID=1872529 RepID=UPI00286F4505|nr:5-formyltetrahydrofolate cyclo-ligase [Anaerosporobacter sp.]
MESKAQIRKQIKELKKNLSKEEIQIRSNQIAERFFSQPFYKQAENIYLYVSYNQEVNTLGMIPRILEDKKRVAVPKIIDGTMDFYEITSLNQLSEGEFGILEPVTCEPVSESEVWNSSSNLMIVPGLAFDKDGGRIGYGGGYYDCYIHKNSERIGLKIAFAYDFQVLEHIEIESFDEKIDGIITDK